MAGSEAVQHSTAFCATYVTVPNPDVAKTIARGLVRNRLAACVNIIPGVTSVYEWEDKIEEDSELILMIKSRCSKIEELTEFVKKNHPYDVCEVITTPITGGNPAYLSWLGDVVKE
ncbi:Divalent ion tolerance protein CutA [Trinorchestia longiramus]|nr:Divalent ion tolerance protein CutA [Trinorchestia longiramus]